MHASIPTLNRGRKEYKIQLVSCNLCKTNTPTTHIHMIPCTPLPSSIPTHGQQCVRTHAHTVHNAHVRMQKCTHRHYNDWAGHFGLTVLPSVIITSTTGTSKSRNPVRDPRLFRATKSSVRTRSNPVCANVGPSPTIGIRCSWDLTSAAFRATPPGANENCT